MNKHAPCCAAIRAQEQVAGVTEAKDPFSRGLGPALSSWLCVLHLMQSSLEYFFTYVCYKKKKKKARHMLVI